MHYSEFKNDDMLTMTSESDGAPITSRHVSASCYPDDVTPLLDGNPMTSALDGAPRWATKYRLSDVRLERGFWCDYRLHSFWSFFVCVAVVYLPKSADNLTLCTADRGFKLLRSC